MNPQNVFCPNIDCPARGQQDKGNISIHSQADRRYKCAECGATFSATKGSLFYRLKTDSITVMLVLTLMAYGCPRKAIVKAFGFDERTIKKWWLRAGEHCEAIHEQIVGQSQLDLEHVQADEIKAKTQGGSVWMAFAMMVSTRLWLGGAVSEKRDKHLIRQVADKVRQVALCRPLLLAVDGLPSYVGAFQRAFRSPLPRWGGQGGRPRLVAWENIAIVQVVKRRSASGLTIERRIVQGGKALVERLLVQSKGGTCINTAYIERLNATFRQRLSTLSRRTRHLARQTETLAAGMYIVGCAYNLCENHKSLRLRLSVGSRGFRWVQRTPAMAAGLTDHQWTMEELWSYRVPPPPWTPPKRRGRPSKALLRTIEKWAI
jgi:transposase-like protein